MSDDSSCSNSTKSPQVYQPGNPDKKAVVLLNMGGPSNLDEVEVFLKNMFADKRILTLKSELLRRLIRFFIVTFRISKAKSHYELIGGSSPLLAHTEKLCGKLREKLQSPTLIAMRYTPPFADEALKKAMELGVNEITLLPLYPHYSTTTVLSSIEDFKECAKKAGFKGKIKEVEPFYANRAFNCIIERQIAQALNGEDADDYELVFSAHGLPQKIIDAGDTYQSDVEEHVEILEQLLFAKGLKFRKVHLAYQSKVGPMKWLNPSLDSVLERMKNPKVLIYPIAFTIDNLETDYELAIEYKEKFAQKFQTYRVARCPNDCEEFADALAQIVESL